MSAVGAGRRQDSQTQTRGQEGEGRVAGEVGGFQAEHHRLPGQVPGADQSRCHDHAQLSGRGQVPLCRRQGSQVAGLHPKEEGQGRHLEPRALDASSQAGLPRHQDRLAGWKTWRRLPGLDAAGDDIAGGQDLAAGQLQGELPYAAADGAGRAADGAEARADDAEAPGPAETGAEDAGDRGGAPADGKGRRTVTQRSWLAAGETPAPADYGTTIAALLLGAPDASLLAGLVPAAERFVAAVFRSRNGIMDAPAARILCRLDDLAGHDVQVVNLSLAGPDNRLLRHVAVRFEQEGRALVAAVGNTGPDNPPQFPAALPAVIAVTAVDAKLRVFNRAARGHGIDLAAPFVTALVTRLLAGTPSLSPNVIRNRLRTAARDLGLPGPDATYGAGLVQTPPQPCDPLSE